MEPGPPPRFAIHESRIDGSLRLSLSGDLDLGTAPGLDARLTQLGTLRSRVSIDLSGLDFIDSTGIRLLVRTIRMARIKHWDVQIEPSMSPQVMRLFKLTHLDRLVGIPG